MAKESKMIERTNGSVFQDLQIQGKEITKETILINTLTQARLERLLYRKINSEMDKELKEPVINDARMEYLTGLYERLDNGTMNETALLQMVLNEILLDNITYTKLLRIIEEKYKEEK